MDSLLDIILKKDIFLLDLFRYILGNSSVFLVTISLIFINSGTFILMSILLVYFFRYGQLSNHEQL